MFSSKNTSQNIPWALLAIEAVLVVLSVLLALGLNSWREGRTHDELAQRAVQGVVDEADFNCSKIKNFQPYHQSVIEGETPPAGIQIGLLRNDAWDSAKSTSAATHIEYSVAETIGSIYAGQSDHRTYVQSYIQAMFNNLSGGGELNEIHTDGEKAVIMEIVRVQKRLLDLYDRLGALLEEYYGDDIELSGFCSE